MKKLFSFATLFLAFNLLNAQESSSTKVENLEAKKEEALRYRIGVSPLPLFIGSFDLHGDVMVSERNTVGLEVDLHPSAFGVSSYGIGANVTHFFSDVVHSDSWIARAGTSYDRTTFNLDALKKTFRSVDEKDLSFNGTFNTFRVSLMGGYNWQWKGGFNLELAIGAAYAFMDTTLQVNNDANRFTLPAKGLVPTGTVNIGVAF